MARCTVSSGSASVVTRVKRRAQAEMRLPRGRGHGRQFRPRGFVLLGQIAEQHAGHEQVGGPQDGDIEVELDRREDRGLPRTRHRDPGFDQEHDDGHHRRAERLAKSPAVGPGQHDEQKEHEEGADGPLTHEGQGRRPQDVEPVERVSVPRRQPRGVMHVGPHHHAVDGIGQQHTVGDLPQARRLGRVDVDRQQRGDGQKGSADGEHALEPLGRNRRPGRRDGRRQGRRRGHDRVSLREVCTGDSAAWLVGASHPHVRPIQRRATAGYDRRGRIREACRLVTSAASRLPPEPGGGPRRWARRSAGSARLRRLPSSASR